jgi:hypothetical protein
VTAVLAEAVELEHQWAAQRCGCLVLEHLRCFSQNLMALDRRNLVRPAPQEPPFENRHKDVPPRFIPICDMLLDKVAQVFLSDQDPGTRERRAGLQVPERPPGAIHGRRQERLAGPDGVHTAIPFSVQVFATQEETGIAAQGSRRSPAGPTANADNWDELYRLYDPPARIRESDGPDDTTSRLGFHVIGTTSAA